MKVIEIDTRDFAVVLLMEPILHFHECPVYHL